jgi:hypothetical protein
MGSACSTPNSDAVRIVDQTFPPAMSAVITIHPEFRWHNCIGRTGRVETVEPSGIVERPAQFPLRYGLVRTDLSRTAAARTRWTVIAKDHRQPIIPGAPPSQFLALL